MNPAGFCGGAFPKYTYLGRRGAHAGLDLGSFLHARSAGPVHVIPAGAGSPDTGTGMSHPRQLPLPPGANLGSLLPCPSRWRAVPPWCMGWVARLPQAMCQGSREMSAPGAMWSWFGLGGPSACPTGGVGWILLQVSGTWGGLHRAGWLQIGAGAALW